MSDSFPILLERRLLARRVNGAEPCEIIVQIGQPYWAEENIEAACPVAIRGLFDRLQDIRGIDFFGAMELSIEFVNSTLSKMRDTYQFSWPDGEPYFNDEK